MSRGNILLELALKGQTSHSDHIYAQRNRSQEESKSTLKKISEVSTSSAINPTKDKDPDFFLKKTVEAETSGVRDCSANPPECTLNPTSTALEETIEAKPPELENIIIELIGCEENYLQAISDVDVMNNSFFVDGDLFQIVEGNALDASLQNIIHQADSELLFEDVVGNNSDENVEAAGISLEFDVENLENRIEIVNNNEDIQIENNTVDETMERDMETIQIQNDIAEDAIAIEGDPDYVPMDESNSSYSDEEQATPALTDNENEVLNQGKKSKKRSRRGRAQKDEWEQQKNKIKRLKGEEYFGRRKNEKGKTVFDVKKGKKIIKPRCKCRINPKTAFKCSKVTEEDRKKTFETFWSLNWGERKFFVQSLVERKSVAQRRVADRQTPRRNQSLFYHLTINTQEKIRVCKKMFINTLSVGEWSILNWMSKNNESDLGDVENEEGIMEQPQNSINSRKSAVDRDKKNLILSFFESLPKLESHYCRKQTNKLYLEPKWQSKAILYRLYESFCKSQGKEPLISSICLFYEVFDTCNLSLFQPKKDQCDICCSFRQGNLSEEKYSSHTDRKENARREKDADKKNAECPNNRTAVFTMDLQAVLLSPDLNASALYYRTKLKVHNFTIFNLSNLDGYCYLWDESEGGLNADEFATIIYNFVTTEIDRNAYNHIIFYSDGCTYQNRNSIVTNALLLAAQETGFTITQKYLEKGHTQMECDSMHATIERKLKNREIYSPSGYEEACRAARLNPKPYKVQYLYHEFFKKYSNLKFVQSIRPGSRKGDPVVTDLRCIEYKPDWSLQVKLNFADTFTELPRRVKKPIEEVVVPSLYQTRIPLDSKKFQHLQEMKSVLPRDVHPFYDTLPHYKPKNGNKLCKRNECSCIIAIRMDSN